MKWNGTGFVFNQNFVTVANQIKVCNIPNAYANNKKTENWIWLLNTLSGGTEVRINTFSDSGTLTLNVGISHNGDFIPTASCFTYNGTYYIALGMGSSLGMEVQQFVNNSGNPANSWSVVSSMQIPRGSGVNSWGTSTTPSDMVVTTLNGDLTAIIACTTTSSQVFRWTGSQWENNGQTNISSAARVRHFQLDGVDYVLFTSYNNNGAGALWRYNTFVKELNYIVSLDYDSLDFFTIGGTV